MVGAGTVMGVGAKAVLVVERQQWQLGQPGQPGQPGQLGQPGHPS